MKPILVFTQVKEDLVHRIEDRIVKVIRVTVDEVGTTNVEKMDVANRDLT